MPRSDESHRFEPIGQRGSATENERLSTLWVRYWDGRDRVVRNELILAYEPLVDIVVARLPSTLRSHWETEDLHSFGLLGLVEAIDRFEAASVLGRFPSYAMARVRGAIFDELRRLDWLPRTVRHRVTAYRSTVEELSGELGRTPETDEVVQHMGLVGSEASSLLQAVQSSQLIHLQQTTTSDDGVEVAPIIDLLVATNDDGPEATILFSERVREVREAITQLPERQRTVISLRFFGNLTQEQIGSMLGVSNSRVCQIESTAIQSLRRMLEEESSVRRGGRLRVG